MADLIKEAIADQVFHLLEGDGLDTGSSDRYAELGGELMFDTEFQRLGPLEALFWVPTLSGPRRCFRIKISEVL